jgi:organic radical activating enzyme
LETNGTLAPSRDGQGRFDWVVVSPKPPEYRIAPGWLGLIDELKVVVDEDLEAATVERLAAANPEAVVFLQPVSDRDSTNAEREDTSRYRESCNRALALVMGHPEWRLSLQVHKLLGIR